MTTTEPAKEVHQVPEPKAPPLVQLQTQLQNLQAQVSQQDDKFNSLNEELPVLRQHLKDAAEVLSQALMAFKDAESRINATGDFAVALETRIQTLERKCQSLSDRPMIRSCPTCTARLDARAQRCPKCSAATPT